MSITLQEMVSDEVRAWLARRRLSASRAAKALQWTDMYLSRRLNNKIPFDLNDLESLAMLLDVPVTAFFGPAEESPRRVTAGADRNFGPGYDKRELFPSPSLTRPFAPAEKTPSGPFQAAAA